MFLYASPLPVLDRGGRKKVWKAPLSTKAERELTKAERELNTEQRKMANAFANSDSGSKQADYSEFRQFKREFTF